MTPWTRARQALLSSTASRSLVKLTLVALRTLSNHLVLCRPLLLVPSIFPNIRVFSRESSLLMRWPKYWSLSFRICPSSEHSGLISFRMERFDLLVVRGTLKSLLHWWATLPLGRANSTLLTLHCPLLMPRIAREYVRKFGLSLTEFFPEDENAWYLIDNIRKRVGEVKRNPSLLNYTVYPSEEGKTAEVERTKIIMFTTFMDVCLLYQMLLCHCFSLIVPCPSAGVNTIISVITPTVKDVLRKLVLSIHLHSVLFCFCRFDQIIGGFDQLPTAIYRNISKRVQLCRKVVRMEQAGESVTAFYQTANKALRSVTADYAMVTSTAKATRRIHFELPLSRDKSHTLRSIHYRSVTKVFLACTEKFWEADRIRDGKSTTDRLDRFIYYVSQNISGDVGVVLASYVYSDDSSFFHAISHDDIISIILEDLSAIHRLPKDYIQAACQSSVIKRWSLDKYRYSMAGFAEPEGRIHFAGEHTTQVHSWLDSAIMSGLRAAREINLAPGKRWVWPHLHLSLSLPSSFEEATKMPSWLPAKRAEKDYLPTR
uniref:L-amino-acid oxidase n=1 Tax=Podarcis muralis TaxID=64176 RepID=A0A670IPY4_PODMU